MTESRAAKAFGFRAKDAERLLEIHADVAGDGPGRKWGVEVLNRSAVVLICASWEAYNEEVVEEAAEFLAANLADPAKLPDGLRQRLAEQKEKEKHELAVWDLAGSGWTRVVVENARSLRSSFNTPNRKKLDWLYENALGLTKVSKCWADTASKAVKAQAEIDNFVELRGAIAHAGEDQQKVLKRQCTAFLKLTKGLVPRIDEHLDSWLKKITKQTFLKSI